MPGAYGGSRRPCRSTFPPRRTVYWQFPHGEPQQGSTIGAMTPEDPREEVPKEEEDPKEVVRRGYDVISYAYRGDNATDGDYRLWTTRFQRYLPRSGTVLDLGCGCGIPVCRILDEAGHSVTGVDISDVQIERARQLVPRATFIRADATQLTFPAASFDGVVCLYALIHIPLSEQLPLLKRIAGWLRPGGALLITTGYTSWTGMEADWHGAPMWWSHADAATYRSWLREARLQITGEDFVSDGDGGHALFYATRDEPMTGVV